MDKKVYAICAFSNIPVRLNPEDTSEMVTQLLFGELVEITHTRNQWKNIEIVHDSYTGWVDAKQLLLISEESASALKNNISLPRQNIEKKILTPWGEVNTLEGSPILTSLNEFHIDENIFAYSTSFLKESSQSISELAIKYLNSPYLWGGRTKYGIDCSGFTQTIYHQLGVLLKRDASLQVKQGKEIKFNNKKEGDLAFFKSKTNGKITHVGIILGENKIIHAHGHVRIDTLDERGIYNEEKEIYSHQLYNIKRLAI